MPKTDRILRSTQVVIGLNAFLNAYRNVRCGLSAGPPPTRPKASATDAERASFSAQYAAWAATNDDCMRDCDYFREWILSHGAGFRFATECPYSGARLHMVALETPYHQEEHFVLVIDVTGTHRTDQTETCRLLARAGGVINVMRYCGRPNVDEGMTCPYLSAYQAGYYTHDDSDAEDGNEYWGEEWDYYTPFPPPRVRPSDRVGWKARKVRRKNESRQSVRYDVRRRQKKLGRGRKLLGFAMQE